MNVTELPFNRHLGLEIAENDTAITLVPRPHHLNHLQTVHATVLFGLAEAASGHALLCRFPKVAKTAIAVLRSSAVKYRKPAIADERCVASAEFESAEADSFQSQFDERGRAMLDVTVRVHQGEVLLLTGTFSWFATGTAS